MGSRHLSIWCSEVDITEPHCYKLIFLHICFWIVSLDQISLNEEGTIWLKYLNINNHYLGLEGTRLEYHIQGSIYLRVYSIILTEVSELRIIKSVHV